MKPTDHMSGNVPDREGDNHSYNPLYRYKDPEDLAQRMVEFEPKEAKTLRELATSLADRDARYGAILDAFSEPLAKDDFQGLKRGLIEAYESSVTPEPRRLILQRLMAEIYSATLHLPMVDEDQDLQVHWMRVGIEAMRRNKFGKR